MASVHEVIAHDGTCLYRGRDVELACEIYDAAPTGTRLRCRPVWTPECASVDEPVPYGLTLTGYAATSRRRIEPAAPDVPVPYALTDHAADLFVVDTSNVVELRRRCPELFTRHRAAGTETQRESRTTARPTNRNVRERMDAR